MAVTSTFSTLKTNVADWLDRTDISVGGGPIDQWVELVEDHFYGSMRMRFMEASTSPAIASGSVAIPADWLETRQAHVINGGVSYKLEPKSSEWIYAYYPQRSADGIPGYMAQEGETWIFGPYPDSGYGEHSVLQPADRAWHRE